MSEIGLASTLDQCYPDHVFVAFLDIWLGSESAMISVPFYNIYIYMYIFNFLEVKSNLQEKDVDIQKDM